MIRLFRRVLYFLFPVIFLFISYGNASETQIRPETIILPLAADGSKVQDGMGSGIQYMLENMMAVNPQTRSTWFSWNIRELFGNEGMYRSFLKGGKPLPDVVFQGRKPGDCYIISGTVSRSGDAFQVRLSFEDVTTPDSRRTVMLPLDLPGCVEFRKGFIVFMNQCGIAFPEAQKTFALWPENLTEQGLAALGKAYESFCSRAYSFDPSPFEPSLCNEAVRLCPDSYLATGLKGWGEYHHKSTQDAVKTFKNALKRNPQGIEALSGLMNSYARLNEESNAVKWGQKASSSRGDSIINGKADAFLAMADSAVQEKNYDSARTHLQKALEIITTTPESSPLKAAATRVRRGFVYTWISWFNPALNDLNIAFTTYEKYLGLSHPTTLAALSIMTRVHRMKGDGVKALSDQTKILEIYRSFAGPPGNPYALALNEAGLTLYSLGRYGEAIEYHKQALDIQLNILGKDHPETACSYQNLGIAYQMTGSYGKALEEFEKALAVRLKVLGPTHFVTGLSYNDLGVLNEWMGHPKNALAFYDKCIPILETGKGATDPFTAGAYHNKGIALQALGRFDEALLCHEKALNIRTARFGPEHPETALSQTGFGCVKYARGDFKGAAEDFKRSLLIREEALGERHPLTAASYFNLGAACFASGNEDDAIRYAGYAMLASEQGEFKELSWRILDLIREVYEKEGRMDEAAVFGKMAVNMIQDMRRNAASMKRSFQMAFMTDKENAFIHLARILVGQGRLAEAQDILTMLKEEEYFDFIMRDKHEAKALSRTIVLAPAEDIWLKGYRDKIKLLANLDRKIRSLEAMAKPAPSKDDESSLEKIKQQYATIAKSLKDLVYQSTADSLTQKKLIDPTASQANLKTVQSRLARYGKGTVMLSYLITKEKLMMILTTPDAQIARETKISSKDLNERICRYLKNLNDVGTDPKKESNQLYASVFAPVARDLEAAGAHTVLVSSCGPLRALPMAALFDGRAYLVEKYAFVLLTPVMDDKTPVFRKFPWVIAGLGTSAKVSEAFSKLPSVQGELDRIIIENNSDKAGIFKGVVRLNNRFTGNTLGDVTDGRYSVIHIATHFSCNPGTASDSFLLLGDGTHLTLQDIQRAAYRFDGIDLFTLSACRTAVEGKDGSGREIESLGTLVQKKGAGSVIASLWPVSDLSTPLLMEKMYGIHKQNWGIGKTEALRKAQMWFYKDYKPDPSIAPDGKEISNTPIYKHPYFWAPFIIMGHL